MLTLADVAEVGTAEIPARFTPSLTVLARETGLGRSTVKTHLSALEEAGWIVRTRPDVKAQWFGERTRYRLTRPESMADLGVGQDVAQVGQEMAQGEPVDGPGVGQELALPRPGDGLLETDHSDLDQISTDRPSRGKDVAIPDRLDVEQVCRHLADRIEANGSKRPTITKTWRDAARRLIDRDGRSVEQITRAIDWCQDDDFWRSNILSMPKLREKYDQLRLAAQRGNRTHKPSTTDQRVGAALQLAARYAEEEAS